MANDQRLKNIFREKGSELLTEMEKALLELENRPDDLELIWNVLRALHSIKGSAGMFGFDNITKFTHEIETVFDMAGKGEVTVTDELVDLTLAAHDHVRNMLYRSDAGDPAEDQRSTEIIASLKRIVGRDTGDSGDRP